MGKLMEIFSCYGCSHKGTLDCRSHFCTLMERRPIKTNIFKEIPEWCPLEDASQPTSTPDGADAASCEEKRWDLE